MKEIRQCSISSIAFTLETDAYDTLFDYIEALRSRYSSNPDGEEIIADIEARIAELILSANGGDRVVAKPLIDNIISQLGSVDDICEEQEEQEGQGGQGGEEGQGGEGEQSEDGESEEDENPQAQSETKKVRRKLYRNVDNAPIGGVCSGVAAYIGCEVALVRLIALLLLFIGGASVWIYIVLWIVIPAAVTARQKLEMRGEPITVSSINDYYNSVMHDTERQSFLSRVLHFAGRFLMLLFKIILVFILIGLLLSFLALMFSLFAVVVTLGSVGSWAVTAVSVMAMISIGMLLALAVYAVMQVINSREIKGNTIFVALIIWLLFSIATALMAVANIGSIRWVIDEIRSLTNGEVNVRIGDDSSMKFNLKSGDFAVQAQELINLIDSQNEEE